VVESDDVLSWSCDKTGAGMGFHVELYGRGFNLDSIEVSETGTDPTASAGFLALIAAQISDEARDWVKTTLVSGLTESATEIDGVPYRIMANAQAQTLQIGTMP
jgi:hypothetical protein